MSKPIHSHNDSTMNQAFIEALKRGEPHAYHRLIKENTQQLQDFLTSFLQSQEDAKDIAQDVFIYLWENRRNLSNVRYLKTYIFSIAKYKAFRKISDRQRFVALQDEQDMEFVALADSPEEILEYDQTHGRLQTIIANLPEMRRKVYEMRMEEARSYEEIADTLCISSSTVRTHFQSALKQIRTSWDDDNQ